MQSFWLPRRPHDRRPGEPHAVAMSGPYPAEWIVHEPVAAGIECDVAEAATQMQGSRGSTRLGMLEPDAPTRFAPMVASPARVATQDAGKAYPVVVLCQRVRVIRHQAEGRRLQNEQAVPEGEGFLVAAPEGVPKDCMGDDMMHALPPKQESCPPKSGLSPFESVEKRRKASISRRS